MSGRGFRSFAGAGGGGGASVPSGSANSVVKLDGAGAFAAGPFFESNASADEASFAIQTGDDLLTGSANTSVVFRSAFANGATSGALRVAWNSDVNEYGEVQIPGQANIGSVGGQAATMGEIRFADGSAIAARNFANTKNLRWISSALLDVDTVYIGNYGSVSGEEPDALRFGANTSVRCFVGTNQVANVTNTAVKISRPLDAIDQYVYFANGILPATGKWREPFNSTDVSNLITVKDSSNTDRTLLQWGDGAGSDYWTVGHANVGLAFFGPYADIYINNLDVLNFNNIYTAVQFLPIIIDELSSYLSFRVASSSVPHPSIGDWRDGYNSGIARVLIGVKDSANNNRALLTWGGGDTIKVGNYWNDTLLASITQGIESSSSGYWQTPSIVFKDYATGTYKITLTQLAAYVADVGAAVTSFRFQQANVGATGNGASFTLQSQNANTSASGTLGGELILQTGTGNTNYGAIQMKGGLVIGRTVKAMADANQTLTPEESIANIIVATGAITANRTLTLSSPVTDSNFRIIDNQTTGASLLVAFATGGAFTIAEGKKALVWGDGSAATGFTITT